MLNDGFDSEPSFTANPNADQTGALAPASYQVGTSGFPNGTQRRGTGALELGFDGTSASGPARVFTNADFVTFANTLNSPIRIRFVINAAPALVGKFECRLGQHHSQFLGSIAQRMEKRRSQ